MFSVTLLVFVILFILLAWVKRVEAGVSIDSGASDVYTITSRYFVFDWEADKTKIKWKETGQEFLFFSDEYLHCSSQKRRGLPEFYEKGERVDLQVNGIDMGCTVTEDWRFADVPPLSGAQEGDFFIRLTYSIWDDKPYFRIRVAAVNNTEDAKWVNFALHADYAEPFGEADKIILFWDNFAIPDEFDKIIPLTEEGITAAWGTQVFNQFESQNMLYLPIFCPFSASTERGMLMFNEPRVAFGVECTPKGSVISRRFYLPAVLGFEEDGIDVGDGAGKVPYDVYLGYVESPTWDKICALYIDAFPWLTRGPNLPVLRGGVGGGNPSYDDFYETTPQYAQLGVKYQHHVSIFTDNPFKETTVHKVQHAQEHGMKPYLWTNIFMAPDVKRVTYDNPELDYRNFEDSWVKDREGKLFRSWDGFACNPSPKFSFGQKQFDLITQLVEQFGLDAVFLDFYLARYGENGVDYNHTYAHYPFYPLDIAQMEWTKALADWLHEQDKTFIVNFPVPWLMVHQFADAVAYDTGHAKLAFWFKTYCVNKPVMFLGDENSLGAMFYGVFVPWWSGRTKDEELFRRFSQNTPIGFYLAESQLMGGDLDEYLFFKHPEGYTFVTARNLSKTRKELPIPLDISLLSLGEAEEYIVLEWDIDRGISKPPLKITAEHLATDLKVTLDPNELKVLTLCPYQDAIATEFALAAPAANVYTETTTGRLSDASWNADSRTLTFAVSGIKDVESVTRLRLVGTGPPRNINVTDCATASHQVDADILTLRIHHALTGKAVACMQW